MTIIIRIAWAIALDVFILLIWGQPEHDGFWSAVYNGLTILGRIVIYQYEKTIVWFPTDITTPYIIGFVIGCLITAAYIFSKSSNEKN